MQQPNAVDAFARGVGIVQKMQENQLRQAIGQRALEQDIARQEAMKGFAQSGDVKEVIPYMTPEQGATIQPKLEGAQLALANKFVDYYDKTKGDLNLATYGPWLDRTLKQFPHANQEMFRDPKSFKDEDEFNDYKWQKEAQIAEFKRRYGYGYPFKSAGGGRMFNATTGEFFDLGPSSTDKFKADLRTSGKGTGRITPAELRQQQYQEWKQNNPEGTWMDFNTEEMKSKQAGKSDFITTTDRSNRKKTVTTRTRQPQSMSPTASTSPAATGIVPPSQYGGKYYSEGGQHFQWDGTKYIPYTGQ